MELLKILGGLAVIAVIVVVIGMDRSETTQTAATTVPQERTFVSGDSSARFVVPDAAPGEAVAAEAAATE